MVEPKAVGLEEDPNRTKEKVGVTAKAKAKEGGRCCPNFYLGVTTPTWICMEGDCASTIRWPNALTPQTAENVPAGGICAAAKAAMRRTQSAIMITRRSDVSKAASAP